MYKQCAKNSSYKVHNMCTIAIIEGGSGMNAMYTLALVHESVYVAVY